MGLTGLHLWELRPGAPPRAVPLDTATTWGRRVWFAPDGQSLTVGTGLGVVEYALRVGDDGRPRLSRSRRWWTTMGVDHWWSPDRTLLAVVPEKRYADVYEWPAEQKPRFTVRHLDRLEYLSFTPDNRLLAGGAWQRPDVKVWDAKTGNVVTTFKTVPTARPIFSPDGRWLVIGTGAAYQFHETDTWKPGLRIAREDCGHNPATGAFTPDGATFAAWSRPGVVTLFDTRDGRELVSLPVTARTGSFDTHGELQFTHDGRKLLVVADMRHVQVWDIADLRGQLATVGLDWESAPAAK
jgi:WD40 repeat protein